MHHLRLADSHDTALHAGSVSLQHGDALSFYEGWRPPTCIISDGPYGLGKFPGEPVSPDALAAWYAPHAAAWARASTPETTLWFWNSEIGWQKAHPALEMHGFQYEECVVWDKGIAHVAGNCNSRTIRGVPVVTEVAVRYTRKATLTGQGGERLSIQDWVRAEWARSGLPKSLANVACGVRNAATRKYLTQCHRWYFPPPEAIARMAAYCEEHGNPTERPYFSLDGRTPITASRWERMRSKWHHAHGLTNVWREPPVHGAERLRSASVGALHANQKPLALMERQILACTDPGDVVWEPFGGLCSATVAALQSGRRAHAAEVNQAYFLVARGRLQTMLARAAEAG
jgi:hypothetical protein